ncbi:MAG: methylenetetrahydrofolate reductase C-terminal domain-containing protein, partial [Anaerolineales bacterium]|nr:methylenetetrahydrofolate reductase C-terminal domain-containing protein [Anaerolineales bacterium]
ALRMSTKLDGDGKNVTDVTVQRQCEWEYLDQIADRVADADLVLSLGCGIGVQAIAEHFPKAWVVPGLNTSFLGIPTEQGVWDERCAACGDCILGLTGGICPIARCSKSLLNGPCGGSEAGHCEIDPNVPCAWQLIYDRMSAMGKLDLLLEIQPPKNWRAARDGGPRRIIRQDLRLTSEED